LEQGPSGIPNGAFPGNAIHPMRNSIGERTLNTEMAHYSAQKSNLAEQAM